MKKTRIETPGGFENRTVSSKKPDMETQWTVSVSPHIRSPRSTAEIMWTVSGTLVPVMLLSIYVFGFRALIITLVSVISCVVVEAISQKALGRNVICE